MVFGKKLVPSLLAVVHYIQLGISENWGKYTLICHFIRYTLLGLCCTPSELL